MLLQADTDQRDLESAVVNFVFATLQQSQGTRSIGQGTNSANRLASTVFACMGSTLMMTMLAAISSATSPTFTPGLVGQAAWIMQGGFTTQARVMRAVS